MDGLHGGAWAAGPLPVGPVAGGEAAYVERPMPVAAAVLWTPVGHTAVDLLYPIFITQRALAAVHANLASRSEGAASFGFLLGNVYTSPDSGLPYVIAESSVDMPWSIAGDHLKSALLQGREIALAEARRSGSRLVGWYHCHVAAHARFSVADAEAHVACFGEPWQVALVVARGADLVGGFFRVGADAAGATEYLPFYELGDGRNVSTVAWANYRSRTVVLAPETAALPADEVVVSGGGARQLVLLPDEGPLEDEFDVGPPAVPARPGLRVTPSLRRGALAALGLVALAGLFTAFRALASGRPEGADLAMGAAPPPARTADLADSVSLAVAGFDVRARLFDSRKMLCSDLARGLVDVEDRWTAYNAGRAVAGTARDAAQVATDRRLHADVAAIEQRFARTGCPRP